MKWDLLDCLIAVKSAWGMVTDATIRNCYRKAYFVIAADRAPSDDHDDVEREFRNIWSSLERIFGDIPSMSNYIDIDTECDVTSVLTDEEIIAEIREQNSADEPALDESTEPEPAPPPTVAEAYKAIDCIRRFTLSSSSEKCEDILRMSEVFEKFVLSETQKRTKQTEITDYFSTD